MLNNGGFYAKIPYGQGEAGVNPARARRREHDKNCFLYSSAAEERMVIGVTEKTENSV